MLYSALLSPERFGAYHDDGIYVTTARALANGEGYRIMSLPYEPAQTKYPPLYPLLLSLIWRLDPRFPQNLLPMMMLSIVAALVFLAITYRYVVNHGYATAAQALSVVALSAINWRMMILATAIYSEMVYAALSVVGLYLAEKYEKQPTRWSSGWLLGVMLGLVFLTRSSGVALLIAVAGYYVLRLGWRRAVLPLAVGGAFVVGWIGWCYLNKTTVDEVNVAYYTSYWGHLNQVINDLHAQGGASKLAIFLNIVVENLVGGIIIALPIICSGLNYSWIPNLGNRVLVIGIFFILSVLLLIVVGFLRDASKRLRLLHIYVIASLGLYLFWLPDVSYDRFAMPLLPFLLLFLTRELGLLMSVARTGFAPGSGIAKILSAAVIVSVVFACLGATLFNYGSGIIWSFSSLKASASRASEDADAIEWINTHSNPSDVLLCYRDPKYFLYTNRKATRSFPMRASVSWKENESALRNLAKLEFQMIDESSGTKYLILTSSDLELEDQPDLHRAILRKLIELYPQRFAPVFESKDARSRIYRIEDKGDER